MRDPRFIKRIIIAAVYLAVFALIGVLLYYFMSPKATCTDGKQNQGEKGIDCGGPCSICKDVAVTQDLVVTEKAVVFGGNDTYDAVVRVENPNNATGSNTFTYEFLFKDAQGNVIAKKEGTSFILPAEKKYVAVLGVATEGNKVATSIDFSIKEIKWAQLPAFEKPALNIYSKRYGPLPVGTGSQAGGLLRNESVYDLNKVIIVIVLRDESGKVIGLNSTEKNTVRSREERDFLLTWPYVLGGEVKNIEMEADSNVYDGQNFTQVR